MIRGLEGFYRSEAAYRSGKMIISYSDMQATIKTHVRNELGAIAGVTIKDESGKSPKDFFNKKTDGGTEMNGTSWKIEHQVGRIHLTSCSENTSGLLKEEVVYWSDRKGKEHVAYRKETSEADATPFAQTYVVKHKDDPHALSGAVKLMQKFRDTYIKQHQAPAA